MAEYAEFGFAALYHSSLNGVVMENIWPKWLGDQRLYEYMLYDLRPSVLPPDCWCPSCHHVCDHPDYPEKEWKKFENDLLVTDEFIFDPECPKCSGPMKVEPFEIIPDWPPLGLVNIHEGIIHKGEYLLHIFGDYHDWLPIEPDNCGITVQLHKVGTYEIPVGWYCMSCSAFTSVDWPEGCPSCKDENYLVAFHPPPTDSQNPYECFGCGGFWFGDKVEEPKECPVCLTESWNRPSPEIEMESAEYYATITSPLKIFEFCNWRFSESHQ